MVMMKENKSNTMSRLYYPSGYNASGLCTYCRCQPAGAFEGVQRAIHYMIMAASLIMFVILINSETYEQQPQPQQEQHQPSSSSLKSRQHIPTNQPQLSNLFSNNGSYKGTPWTNERTISVQTAAETKFARCDVHSVSSEDGQSTVNDWIFIEEMDAVNVLVMTYDKMFIVFKQKKYAIPGQTLSPIGGFIDKGEAPWESARREVMEEVGLGSRVTLNKLNQVQQIDSVDNKVAFSALTKRERTEDEFGLADGDTNEDEVDWVFLGRYRTAANRGGGFIYTYLLKDAVPILEGGGKSTFKGSGDDEDQEIHFLSMEEMKRHTLDGHFQEVKWTATIALALLHLQS